MEKQRKIINGFVLLRDKNCSLSRVVEHLKKDWEIETTSKIEKDNLIFYLGNTMIALSFIPAPVPNGEAEENASHNYLWRNGVEETSQHKAQVIVAVAGDNALETSQIFTKVAASVLKLDNAIGIYKYPTVISAEDFIEVAEYIKDDELPLANMIYIGLYNSEKGVSGYTMGLDFFGKKEVEVLNTSLEPFDLYNFLYDIAYYIIDSNVELKDGETIGFTAEQKLPIEISKGVALEGETVKIAYDVTKN